ACGAEPDSARPRSAADLAGEGLVLVVDDKKNVRISTALLLQGLGFRVIVACDGVEAVDVIRSAAGRIDAVLLDLTMPRMDGIETLRELRRIAPGIPVILSSGYGSTPLDDESRLSGGPDAVLPKPYAAEHLVATLRRVIRNRG